MTLDAYIMYVLCLPASPCRAGMSPAGGVSVQPLPPPPCAHFHSSPPAPSAAAAPAKQTPHSHHNHHKQH